MARHRVTCPLDRSLVGRVNDCGGPCALFDDLLRAINADASAAHLPVACSLEPRVRLGATNRRDAEALPQRRSDFALLAGRRQFDHAPGVTRRPGPVRIIGPQARSRSGRRRAQRRQGTPEKRSAQARASAAEPPCRGIVLAPIGVGTGEGDDAIGVAARRLLACDRRARVRRHACFRNRCG
ncbi:hypothetical protein I41_25180 [Lacipirellula limnantheis]|uniref:Uncharacterized protein n=1 Tax=Lacipirellula limnantheis TaxID=2528024 RepID=A0A517TY80_9BACT|nr:hypothetical protein I41_25180 [Lacipirellula limnantheis]